MASLTDQLDLASSSRRIIDPQNNKGPTFLGALADFAGTAISEGADLLTSRTNRLAREAAQEDEASKAAARNDTAAFIIRAKRGELSDEIMVPAPPLPDAAMPGDDGWNQPPPIDAELEGAPMPPDVTRVVEDASRAQRAEEQGRAPVGSGRIRAEAALDNLLARYPDRQEEIYKLLKEAGIDHYIFRESEIAKNDFKIELAQEEAMRTTQFQAAVDAGVFVNGMSREMAEEAGRRILFEQERLKRLKAIQDYDVGQENLETARQNRLDATQTRESVNSYLNIAKSMFGPSLDALNSRIVGENYLGTDGSQQDFNKIQTAIVPEISRGYEGLINKAYAEGFTEAARALEADRDRTIKMVTDLFNGDSTAFAHRKRVLEDIKTTMGLEVAEALPVYSFITAAFGQGIINEHITLNNLIPKEALDNLAKDLRGFDGVIDSAEERLTVSKLAAAIAGADVFKQLPESQARAVIGSAAAIHMAGAPAVVNNPDPTTLKSYQDSGFRLSEAALSLQPGMAYDAYSRNVPAAAGSLFGPGLLQADRAFMAQDSAEGKELILSKRAAAQNILIVSRGSQINADLARRGWSVQYTAVNGSYAFRPILDETKYKQWAESQREMVSASAGRWRGDFVATARSVTTPTYEEALRNPPQELNRRSGSMQLAMKYLMETNDVDESMQGTSANDARNFFATGAPTAKMIADRAEAAQRSTASETGTIDDQLVANFRQAADTAQTGAREAQSNRLTRERTTASQQANKDLVRPKAEAAGVSWTLVDRLVQKESSWGANAENTTTKARGLFQINDNRERSVEENIRDGLNLLKTAQRSAQRVLGREPSDAETYVMYQQGDGGGAALLNPSNATRNAIDVLTSVYERSHPGRGRQLATQAVTANMGDPSMTAAEFARTIMAYFNR